MTRAAWYREQAEKYGYNTRLQVEALVFYPEALLESAQIAFHFAICALEAEADEAFETYCKEHPRQHWPGAEERV